MLQSSINAPAPNAGAELTLEIVREFDAPPELVFDMWVKSQHMSNWAAPDGFTIVNNDGDARLGGKWRGCMRSPAGEELWLSGTFREITPPTRLVFTHQWDGGIETLVRISFEALPGRRTRMVFRQSGFESVASRDGHEGGWRQSFDKLQPYLAQYLAADGQS